MGGNSRLSAPSAAIEGGKMDFFDWFDDEFGIEDFALIGGLIGAVEDELEEERKQKGSQDFRVRDAYGDEYGS